MAGGKAAGIFPKPPSKRRNLPDVCSPKKRPSPKVTLFWKKNPGMNEVMKLDGIKFVLVFFICNIQPKMMNSSFFNWDYK